MEEWRKGRREGEKERRKKGRKEAERKKKRKIDGSWPTLKRIASL